MKEIKLHEVVPREKAGRETIARYQAQFRAASYACLSILENKEIDRVYCDYHDDFVIRKTVNHSVYYHFFQVKTKSKKNYLWTLLDLFGMYKNNKEQKVEKIYNSFMGKLLIHTVKFNESCNEVVLMTNIQCDDAVESVMSDIKTNSFFNNNTRQLILKFNECFSFGGPQYSEEEVIVILKKLSIMPGVQYLNDDDDSFAAIARDAIYKYSEIDLEFIETEEIIKNLLFLVEKKSFSKVMDEIDEHELDDIAGVGINDLLEILSISKSAYHQLLQGEDIKALKAASIIQRTLKKSNAPDGMIEYCSKLKTDWDGWYRDKRHVIPEFDLNFIQMP